MKTSARWHEHILNRQRLGLLVITLLALLPRLVRTDIMEFKHDEAVAWLRATALVHGQEFPLTGLVSSKGVENFPLFIYLLGTCRVILPQPEKLVLIIALLNGLSVILIFQGSRIFLNARTAWLAALLYAVSPCAVMASRKLWAQNLLPFWTSAIFCVTAMLFTGQSKRPSLLSGLFMVLMVTAPQIHLSAIFLVTAWCVIVFFKRATFKIRPVILGAVMGLLPTLPYVFFQLQHRAAGIFRVGEHAAAFSHFRFKELLLYFLRQPVDEGIYGMLGSDYRPFVRAIAGYTVLRYFLSLAVAVGLMLIIFRVMRGKDNRQGYGILATLTVIPLILVGLSHIPLIPSYFLALYPLPFILAALLLAEGWKWLREHFSPRLVDGAFVCLILVILGYQLIYIFCLLSKIDTDGGGRGDYGASYAALGEAAERLSHDERAINALPPEDLNLLALIVTSHLNGTEMNPIPRHRASSFSADSYRFPTPLTDWQRREASQVRTLALRLLQSPRPGNAKASRAQTRRSQKSNPASRMNSGASVHIRPSVA